ncbi:radical SAM/SPASM domain-containing protein [Ornithinimicrobium avium]|uniref:radical SAM/SPASM domain-containing protein n=1 Tax=Ornithinimicrobium avium TaxID=2283195 RepID=UPI0013B464A5|nr:radical SAM protein [Ornithinimicrobium avium]
MIQSLAGLADTLPDAERELLYPAVLAQLDPADRLRASSDSTQLFNPAELRLVERLDAVPVEVPPRGRGLTLIVKGTRLCNLRCSYCNDWRAGPDQTMRLPVLAHTLLKALRHSNPAVLDVVWHGGETTLLPRRFYERALYLQSRFRQPGTIIRNEIQTNATRIDAEWAAFLARHSFSVGISLDGPAEIHDRTRRYVSGAGSFADVLRGVRVLRDHGIEPSVLMVLDEEALALGPRRIFDFFLEAGLPRFGLLPVKPPNNPSAAPGTPADRYVDPPRFMAFMTELDDIWREHGDPDVHIRELEVLRRKVAGTRHRPCTLAGGCLGAYYLVEPDGRVAHCDLFLGDERYTLGNVLTQDFLSMAASPAMEALREANEHALEGMRRCPGFDVCQGWCPHERYTSARHNPSHRADCCGLLPLIDHVRARPVPLDADGIPQPRDLLPDPCTDSGDPPRRARQFRPRERV